MRKKKDKKYIRLLTINLSFVLIVAVFSVGVVVTHHILQKEYDTAIQSQQMLVACNDAANTLQGESDALTLCADEYVDTVSSSALWQYYSIIGNKLRERELGRAESYAVDCSFLREALVLSDELSRRETHAFALIAQANGTIDTAPEQVRSYALSAVEMQKTAAEKTTLAQHLVHGSEYNSYKKRIYQKIDAFQTDVLAVAQRHVIRETKLFKHSLNYLHIITATGNVLMVLMAIVLYKKVTVVLRDYIASVEGGQSMEERGTAEMRYLARVFNAYLSLQKREKAALRKKANIDPLTQIGNRRALVDFVTAQLDTAGESGVFLFLDVDDFKQINDTYGHDTGDLVLRHLANEIAETLTETETVGRLGGDEFAVWLDVRGADAAAAVEKRVAAWSGSVLCKNGAEPTVSLSVGAVFCKAGDSYSEVFKRADLALYHQKRNGKGGCTFFEDIEQ